MTTIIETLESGIADLVYYNNAFTEVYTLYIEESNKPSKDYGNSKATEFLRRAGRCAKIAIETAQDLGLDPSKVCRDCVNFQESYKKYA